MQTTMRAVLSNAQHPEYGQATIPLPITSGEYDHAVEMLERLKIGDAVGRDCQVDEIVGEFPILKQLERQAVNVDELDYLAKRMDSFDAQEQAQFQAMGSFAPGVSYFLLVQKVTKRHGEFRSPERVTFLLVQKSYQKTHQGQAPGSRRTTLVDWQ